MPEDNKMQIGDLDLAIPKTVGDLAEKLMSQKKLLELDVSPKKKYRVYKAKDAIEGQHEETFPSGFKVTLGGSVGGKFEISAFNSPDDKDPDKVVRADDEKAWLKYELAADVKSSVGAAGGDLKFGLDASLGLRLLQYRSHGVNEELGAALLNDFGSYQLALRESDVFELIDGDVLAYIVSGTLAFSAQLTWSDIVSSSVQALDEALGVEAISTFNLDLGAKVGFTIGASDDYRLIFRGTGERDTTVVELRKAETRKVGVSAELGLDVGFSDPDALVKVLNVYLSGRLGIDDAKTLIDKIDGAASFEDLGSTERALAEQAAKSLGLDGLQDWWKELKEKVDGLWTELDDTIRKVAEARVKASFQMAYSRVATDQLVLKCEVKNDRLSENHEHLLRGNFSGLVDAIAEGKNGYTLIEYLRTETVTRVFSFGFGLSIGSWAAGSRSVNTKTWTRQPNIRNHERVGFEGKKTYTGTWGPESYRYGFELSASMGDFSAAAKANCSELDFKMGFNWSWSRKLDGAVLRNALDLAAVWGVLSDEEADAAFGEVGDLMGKDAVVEVELGFSDRGVRTLLGVDREDLYRLWMKGLALGLPRVTIPRRIYRSSLADRLTVYGEAAQYAFEEGSGVDPDLVLRRVSYRGQPDLMLRRIDFGEDRSGANYVLSLPVLWNLGSTRVRTLPAGIAKRTYKTLHELYSRTSGGKKEAVEHAYGNLQGLFSKRPFNMRIAGHVFSSVVREDGGLGELTGSVKVTTEQGGKVVLIA